VAECHLIGKGWDHKEAFCLSTKKKKKRKRKKKIAEVSSVKPSCINMMVVRQM